MKVVHFHRNPYPGQFSIEFYFEAVRNHLPSSFIVRKQLSKYHSKGLLKRLYNMFEAAFQQGDVNHITGDVHFLSLLMRRKKTILTVLDCEMLDRLSGMRRLVLKFFWFTLPLRKVAWVTTISQATKDRLLEIVDFPEERITVVPVCISDAFSPKPFHFNAECPNILQVGTKHNKNLNRLIEALEGIDCKLTILGKLSEVQTEQLRTHKIQYQSHSGLDLEAVVSLYENCDILAFASTCEGFGMPIVEAQVVERPVLTSNCSSMPEVAGEGACFVDPLSVASIRDGLLRIINNATFRDEIVERGRLNRKRYHIRSIVTQYEAIYDKVGKQG